MSDEYFWDELIKVVDLYSMLIPADQREHETAPLYAGIAAHRTKLEAAEGHARALRRIVRRTLACGQLEKLEDARQALANLERALRDIRIHTVVTASAPGVEALRYALAALVTLEGYVLDASQPTPVEPACVDCGRPLHEGPCTQPPAAPLTVEAFRAELVAALETSGNEPMKWLARELRGLERAQKGGG